MDFSLSKEQSELFDLVKNFAEKNLNDNIFDDDEHSRFPREKWDLCRNFGIHGLPIPEEYGGMGYSMLTTAVGIEALGYGCKDEGLIFSICAHMLTSSIPIWQFGSEAQKQTYLPKLSTGEYIGGNGASEAGAGSDLTSMSTLIKKENDQYILNGSKIFVTNGPVADLLVIYGKHPNGMKMADISAFVIESTNPDIKTGQVFKKMGLRTSLISEIILDDCKLSSDNILGRERFGMRVFNHSMLWERIIMAAYHVGVMEQQYDMLLEYAGVREQFNSKLIKFQTIADKLIEMKMRIETSKLMLYKACWNYDNNKCEMADASMVKLYTSEARVKNSLDSLYIFGGYGYMKESLVEKQLRDSIAAKIYSGTSEIQKKIISESMGKFYE